MSCFYKYSSDPVSDATRLPLPSSCHKSIISCTKYDNINENMNAQDIWNCKKGTYLSISNTQWHVSLKGARAHNL